MDDGAVSLSVGDQDYALNGRWFWSAYPGPRIRFNAAVGTRFWVHRYVAFRGPLVARWQADGLFPIAPQRPSGDDAAERFDAILAQSRQPGRWAAVRTAHLIEGLLIDLAAARAATPAPSAWVDSVTRQLASRSVNPIDYAQLAEKLGMSVRSLRRNFRQRLGVSPHQFLIGQRVTRARALLLSTNLPLKGIARQLGYADVFYFGRQFKRQTGVSPATFRRSREG
jgi:AraC-like DNA-binding protein